MNDTFFIIYRNWSFVDISFTIRFNFPNLSLCPKSFIVFPIYIHPSPVLIKRGNQGWWYLWCWHRGRLIRVETGITNITQFSLLPPVPCPSTGAKSLIIFVRFWWETWYLPAFSLSWQTEINFILSPEMGLTSTIRGHLFSLTHTSSISLSWGLSSSESSLNSC